MTDEVKPILRKQVLQYRKMLPESVWEQRNDLLQHRVLDFINRSSATVIHSFLPISRNREVNTWPIVKEMAAGKKNVVISSVDMVNKNMFHYYYQSDLEFRLNSLKIPEPVDANEADMTTVNLILVPFLAADKQGNRIGYGQGYYDRLLKTFPQMKKVGLTLGPLFDAFSFAEGHDIQLDVCISPFQTFIADE